MLLSEDAGDDDAAVVEKLIHRIVLHCPHVQLPHLEVLLLRKVPLVSWCKVLYMLHEAYGVLDVLLRKM